MSATPIPAELCDDTVPLAQRAQRLLAFHRENPAQRPLPGDQQVIQSLLEHQSIEAALAVALCLDAAAITSALELVLKAFPVTDSKGKLSSSHSAVLATLGAQQLVELGHWALNHGDLSKRSYRIAEAAIAEASRRIPDGAEALPMLAFRCPEIAEEELRTKPGRYSRSGLAELGTELMMHAIVGCDYGLAGPTPPKWARR